MSALTASQSQPSNGVKPARSSRQHRRDHLNALEWTDALTVAAFGVELHIRSNEADLLRDSLRYLPHGWKRTSARLPGSLYSLASEDRSSSGLSTIFRLCRDERQIFTCEDRTEFLECFGSTLALHVADASRERVFVHAGVVGWDDHAIVIPGRSFSGKTTLVTELVRAGATYYSDEFALIDKDGLVHPYAQPLQIRENGSSRQTEYPVEQLGGVAGGKPLPIALVVFARYRTDAHWRPRQLSPGVGLLEILNNTVSARSAPALALSSLKQAVANAIIVRGTRGEAAQLVEWIAAHFNSRGDSLGQTR